MDNLLGNLGRHLQFFATFAKNSFVMELEPLQNKIYEIRDCKVMLDFDLAALYKVSTKALKQAVRRNIERFPDDFMFEITNDEYNYLKMSLRSQIVTSNEDGKKGGIRYLPFAFTEQGVAILSGLLNSEVAATG